MTISKAARREKRMRDLARRRAARDRAVALAKEKDLPLAAERVPALWQVDDRPGHFLAGQTGFKAFDAKRKRIVRLRPADEEFAIGMIRKSVEEAACWKDYFASVPF